MQRETRQNCDKYINLRKEANAVFRTNKREMMNKRVDKIEEMNITGNSRQINWIRKVFQPRIHTCKKKSDL